VRPAAACGRQAGHAGASRGQDGWGGEACRVQANVRGAYKVGRGHTCGYEERQRGAGFYTREKMVDKQLSLRQGCDRG
jgi:hypothetical protein